MLEYPYYHLAAPEIPFSASPGSIEACTCTVHSSVCGMHVSGFTPCIAAELCSQNQIAGMVNRVLLCRSRVTKWKGEQYDRDMTEDMEFWERFSSTGGIVGVPMQTPTSIRSFRRKKGIQRHTTSQQACDRMTQRRGWVGVFQGTSPISEGHWPTHERTTRPVFTQTPGAYSGPRGL